MKRTMLASLLAIAVAVGGTSTTQALHNTTSLTDELISTVSTVRQQTTPANTEEDKRLELEARKQEIEQRIAEKRAAISEKLMGARAERCMSKQATINTMLDTRVEAAQKHFDKFKAIQDRLVALVEEKGIDVENHAALELIMSDLELKAQTSITILGTTDFNCEDADASAPGGIVKDQVAVAKQDLKNYRDAIKDYAVAIKASIKPAAETPSVTTETPPEQTESTEETTEEVQQ